MKHTEKYGLNIIEDSDAIDCSVINQNTEFIEELIKTNADDIETVEETVSDDIATINKRLKRVEIKVTEAVKSFDDYITGDSFSVKNTNSEAVTVEYNGFSEDIPAGEMVEIRIFTDESDYHLELMASFDVELTYQMRNQRYIDKKTKKIIPEIITDSELLSTKVVPEGASFAGIVMIGGKTVKTENLLHSAPVEKIVSIGVNFFNPVTAIQIKNGSISNEDGTITNSGGSFTCYENYYRVQPDDKITIILSNKTSRIRLAEYDRNKNFIARQENTTSGVNKYTFTISSNTCFVRLAFYANTEVSGITLPNTNDIYANRNDSNKIDFFESIYDLSEITKNLPDYGCSAEEVYNYIDFEEGRYYHNVGSVDLGTLNWKRFKANNFNVAYFLEQYNVKRPVTNNDIPNLVCVPYIACSVNDVMPNSIYIGNNFNCYDNEIDDVNELKEKLNDVILNYELATPEIIDIKPLFPILPVEEGGTITLVNEYNLDVPNTIKYKVGD